MSKKKKETPQNNNTTVKEWQERHPIENWAYKMIKRAGRFGLFMYEFHPLNIDYDALQRRANLTNTEYFDYILPRTNLHVKLSNSSILRWKTNSVVSNLQGRRIFRKLKNDQITTMLIEQSYLSHKSKFKTQFNTLWWYRMFFGTVFMVLGFAALYGIAVIIFGFKTASIGFSILGLYALCKVDLFFIGYRNLIKTKKL